MTNFTNEQRIAKIDELLKQINPLNYKKIFIETNLYFLKEKYFKNYDEKEKVEIIEKEQKLLDINQQLSPLFSELRQYQNLYYIQYDGEFSHTNGQTFWQTQNEYFYLKTNCNIDTTTSSGWSPYVDDPNVRQLLNELHEFLLYNRFTNFKIRDIKRQ